LASKRKRSVVAPAPTRVARFARRESWLAVLALLLLLVLLYPEPIFQGAVYSSPDARNADAFDLVGDVALAAGDYPLWNPYLFCGMPTFGSMAYVPFLYPPAEVFTFLQNEVGLPPLTWLLAHLLLGGLGMYHLLGRWRLPPGARTVGVVAWLMFPKVVAWAVYGHGSKLGAAMYLPWIVALTLDVMDGRGRRRAAVLGLLLGVQILRGHIQITYYTLLVVGLVAVARWWSALAARRRGEGSLPWSRTGLLAVALAIAFLVGAVLLAPVHEYAGLSVRGAAESGGAGYDYATGWSLSPRELGTLLLPSAAGFGRGTYQGMMPFTDYPNYFGLLMLALVAAAAGTRPLWRTRWLFAVGGLALLVSFGRFFPVLYGPLYALLPYFNKFRIPSMALALTAFAAAVLAALGAARLAGDPDGAPPSRTGWRRHLPKGLAICAVLALIGAAGVGRGIFAAQLKGLAAAAGKPAPSAQALSAAWDLGAADLLRIGLVLAAAAAALAAAGRSVFLRRLLPWALALLLALDLAGVDRLITHPERGLRVALPESGRLVPAGPMVRPYAPAGEDLGSGPDYEALAGLAGHERVWPLGALGGDNGFMVAGVRSLGGYHPAKPALYETVRALIYDPTRPAGHLVSWLGGAVVAAPSPLPGTILPALADLGVALDPDPLHAGGMILYRNASALPRARLTDAWRPAAGTPEEFLERLRRDGPPADGAVELDRRPDPLPQAGIEALPPVRYLEDGLDAVTLSVSTPRPALLVLADLNLPGWRVAVDGRPAELLRADHLLRAVALDAGDHEVRFAYRDPAVLVGFRLSLLGLILALVLLMPWPVRGAPVRSAAARSSANAEDAA